LTTIFAIFPLTLASCGENDYESEINGDGIYEVVEYDILFVEPSVFSPAGPMFRARGYTVEAEINGRRYFFAIDNEYVNQNFIDRTEALIYQVGNMVALPQTRVPARISLLTDGDYTFDPFRPLSINHGDINTLGWLIHELSDRRLPIWFSAGIESVARNLVDSPPSPGDIPRGFGDFYFAPTFWGTEEQAKAILTAHHFVSYLYKNGLLAELAELYIQENTSAAHKFAEEHFYSFAGQPMIASFALELGTMFHDQGYYIRKSTDWGEYVFIFETFEQFFSLDDTLYYIDYIDRATQFVVEWYSQVFDFDFEPIVNRIYQRELLADEAGDGGAIAFALYGLNRMSYAGLNWMLPYIAAHEVSHILEFEMGSFPFPPFSEGLAHALNHYFDSNAINLLWEKRFTSYHQIAHLMFDTGAYRDISDIGSIYIEERHDYVLELSARGTVTSFVKYLIETYGVEKYMQVHWGIVRFEDTFGITLDDMILQWREFLTQYAAAN